MANIPTVSGSEVRSPGVGAVPMQQIGSGAFQAGGRAMVAAGETVMGGSQLLARFAFEKQEQVNRGVLANEETLRMETAAQIRDSVENMPDRPDEWQAVSDASWSAYEKGRSARQKAGKWGRDLAAADDLQFKTYRAEVVTRLKGEQVKAEIRQSNARIEANAETKLRAGDYDGFVKAIDAMTLFPEQKERTVRRGLEEGLTKIAGNQLDALRDLPPSKAVPAIEAFIANLNEKGADGRFKDYEYERGGLSLGARQQMEAVARSRIREQERAMDVNGRAVVAKIRMGRATEADLFQLVKAGELTPDVAKDILPDVAMAIDEWQGKVDTKQAAKDAKAEAEQARAEAKAESLKRRAEETAQQQSSTADRLRASAERGKVGLRDIERQLALGEINPEQAAKLKAELSTSALSEQRTEVGEFATISNRIRSAMAGKLLEAGNVQPDDADYEKIRNAITSAKTLTKESRLRLIDQFFALKLSDIKDLQEEGPAGGRWADRDITPVERDLRRGMITKYRELLPALGDVAAGDLLLNQETEVRSFFDSAKAPRTQAEIEKFMQKLMKPVYEAAGTKALREVFDF